ncbi:zinc finger protein 596-like [Trichogramma pretiosum]|uniref:zinc finger protein 596-like n=1 Tax=Trichogramma pretiosum TaxID=7493 RepID=UPI0006C95FFD|nr:zinc finger protein 596-like [Trichogramma pretiosum]
MEASRLFNSAIRIKLEPVDVSLREHDDRDAIGKIPDHENIQISTFLLKNQTCKLEKCDKNQETELDDDMQIVLECQDVKPTWNILAAEKIEDKTLVKVETLGAVKKEFIVDEAEKCMNFNYELGEHSQERNVTKDCNIGHKRKVRSSTDISDITHNCDTCGKAFGRKYSIKRHIDAVHKKKTHTCETCGNTFTRKNDMTRHIASVHGKIRHKCDLCEKKFSRKIILKQHVDRVHREITHECDLCGKKFSFKSQLKQHVDATHKGVEPACNVCGKKFASKRSIKRHVDATHKGVKPACDVCGKTFVRKDILNVHIDSVHKKKTHTCDTCGKSFTHKSSLSTHITSHHSHRKAK